MNLQELKADLLADGIIDAAEVEKIKEILYADGVIDKEEADFLFELNDAVTGKDNDSSWETFFIQAIADFLLKDEVSPGE
ncbi:MAG: TerB family tellurite resistance protein, partial [Bacteroidaceae bacterium]|nr:TerB family tellurite resistance protein [Bacteroidaceae bacterium]